MVDGRELRIRLAIRVGDHARRVEAGAAWCIGGALNEAVESLCGCAVNGGDRQQYWAAGAARLRRSDAGVGQVGIAAVALDRWTWRSSGSRLITVASSPGAAAGANDWISKSGRHKISVPRMSKQLGRLRPKVDRRRCGATNLRSDLLKYLLLIHQNPTAVQALSEADKESLMSDAGKIMDELGETGEWVGGEALADPTTAKSVRVRDGVTAVTDGPYAEAKEQFVGYCIVDCDGIDRAVEIAAQWPDARLWGMEVRAVLSPDGVEM